MPGTGKKLSTISNAIACNIFCSQKFEQKNRVEKLFASLTLCDLYSYIDIFGIKYSVQTGKLEDKKHIQECEPDYFVRVASLASLPALGEFLLELRLRH